MSEEDYKKYLEVLNVDLDDKDDCSNKLLQALTIEDVSHSELIEGKNHFKYFLNYLFLDKDGLRAETIFIEKEYTSLPYLGDYLNYYAQCYFPYKKTCRRIHFFKPKIQLEEFMEMIFEKKHSKYWGENYLGYLVIKPLNRQMIGASLIKPYGKKENRAFPTETKYSVNIFGHDECLNTLSYQEQDGIVGSCASVAIWFAFQKTAELFRTQLPTPSDITISAGFDVQQSGKIFPSKALNTPQICKAIQVNGLIAELRDSKSHLKDKRWIKAFIFSYIRMGVPILLGLQLEGGGGHLVTITGYRLDPEISDNSYKNSLLANEFLSDQITKLYVHDDQSGPFSRMEFQKDKKMQFSTSIWKQATENDEVYSANAFFLIVPLYPSIRVTFEGILDEINNVASKLEIAEIDGLKWDAFLSHCNTYKSDMRNKIIGSHSSNDHDVNQFLLKSLPQYIWVIQAWKDDKLFFDVIYDAADINRIPFHSTIYDHQFRKELKEAGAELFDILFGQGGGIINDLIDDNALQRTIQILINKYTEQMKDLSLNDQINYIREHHFQELRDSAVEQQKKHLEKRKKGKK